MRRLDQLLSQISRFWESILGIARSFQFKDAIDITIIALLLYGIIKLVRETRAGQLVKGLLLLIVLLIVSNRLQLVMVNQALTYFFSFAFVALLIIFQPEIRKALEQMGRSNMSQSLMNAVSARERDDKAHVRRAINAVVEGIGILQQLQMGALIVFERQTNLGEIIATGTAVNCAPSGPLIGNIFFNKAPLHDGAVVIRDGTIAAAGCILPLTQNDVSAELGTRHRAAIGMSEESDAVVVVVSEETAQISVAVNGHLTRDYTRDTLRSVLESWLVPQEEKSAGGPRRLRFLKKRKAVKK